MEDNIKITSKHIIILLVASIVLVFFHNLDMAWYIKDVRSEERRVGKECM